MGVTIVQLVDRESIHRLCGPEGATWDDTGSDGHPGFTDDTQDLLSCYPCDDP